MKRISPNEKWSEGKGVDGSGAEALERVPRLSTMGRAAVLRLVFTTTGTPVRASTSESIRASSGSFSGSTV